MTTVALSTTAKSLVRSTFFGKDFETYVAELKDFIQLTYGTEVFSNIVASELGIMLIEMFSFGLSTMSWYGDRQADDTNLLDCRIRTAAVTIARQLGYKASAAVPAAVDLTLTLAFPPLITRLTLERGRVLIGPGGLDFELTQEVIFEVGQVGPKALSAREGIRVEEIFTSTGEPNQFFNIDTVPEGKSIAQSTVQVFVNGLEWSESVLLTYDQTNQFEVFYGLNPARLQFGDGVAGNVPLKDSEIRVLFLATSGAAGAVSSQTVVSFKVPLTAGTQTLAGTLDQPLPSTSGSDQETIASIKVNAPLVFQTAQRAVTQADYDALINAFIDPVYGAVGIGRATVPRTVAADATAQTIISQIEASCPVIVVVGAASATYVVGERITGGTSGATGILIGVVGSTLSISSLGTGSFVVGERVTGTTSTAFATVLSVTMSPIASSLETYWDKVLSSNCKANIVVAQILATDSSGRYVTAAVGLARALEAYLDARAESTVKVTVIDGSINLLRTNISCDVHLLSSFTSEAARESARAQASNALQTVMLGRNYGQSLRISDLYSLIEEIDGVDWTNISATSVNGAPATGFVNSFGDMVIQSYQVITLGDPITVNLV